MNFKDHKFQPTSEGELLEKGFYVGRQLWISKRFTAEFGPSKVRRDLNVGTSGIMKGTVKDMPVVVFESMVNKKLMETSVAIKTINLRFEAPAVSCRESLVISLYIYILFVILCCRI